MRHAIAALVLSLTSMTPFISPAVEGEKPTVAQQAAAVPVAVDAWVTAAYAQQAWVYDLRGAQPGETSLDAMLCRLADADIVFLGEQHDSGAAHRLELATLDYLAQRRQVALAMEMFERDVQPQLDGYLSGSIAETAFLDGSRPWGNYVPDYRPLIEYAKAHCIPVTGSNAPTALVRRISRSNWDAAWGSYSTEERSWLARKAVFPRDAYWDNFYAVMGGGGESHGMALDDEKIFRFYQAQVLKDATMAQAIAGLRHSDPGQLVLHVNGSFHSDFRLGTAARAIEHRPCDDVVTVTFRALAEGQQPDPAAEPGAADFLVFVPAG